MPTTPPTITSAPSPAPQRGEKTTFAARMDAFVTWVSAAVAQFGAAATNVNANASEALTSATNAAASATSASGSASAAATASGAILWVSGTTYAVGDCRFSPINTATYRRRSGTAGAGTTDPSLDATNWALISYFSPPYLHVRDERSSGTGGAASTAATQNIRVLNTVVGSNTIAGSSLASNVVTLPAGTYDFLASGAQNQGAAGSANRLTLYNVTDSSDIVVGMNSTTGTSGGGAAPSDTAAVCSGRFTIATTKTVRLHHYTSTAMGFGGQVSTGQAEVYASLQFWKVA